MVCLLCLIIALCGLFDCGGHFQMGRARCLELVGRGSGTVGKFEKYLKVQSLAKNNEETRDENLGRPSFDVSATWGERK